MAEAIEHTWEVGSPVWKAPRTWKVIMAVHLPGDWRDEGVPYRFVTGTPSFEGGSLIFRVDGELAAAFGPGRWSELRRCSEKGRDDA